MSGASIDIAANTRAAQRNVKDLGEAFDGVADSLDDVAREGDRSADKLESSFRDMVRTADDAGDKIKKKISGGLKDASSEAGQSGREAAASFSGEFDDVSDFVQETVANAFGGFGPIGAAAGVAAAAGLGILTAEMTKQQEAADEIRERLTSAYSDAAEAGRTYLDTAQIIAEAQSLMFDKDRAEEYATLLDDQKRIGADWYTLVAAHTGDLNAQREIQSGINGLLESEAGTYETIRDGVQKVNPEVQGMADRWGLVIEESEKASGAARDYKKFVEEAGQSARDQADKTAQVAGERYAGIAEQYKNPQEMMIVIDDSAVRKYMLNPPTIVFPSRIANPAGSRQLIF